MAGLEAQKRPLMLAALNGLSVARVPVPEDSQDEGAKVPMDERVRIGLAKQSSFFFFFGGRGGGCQQWSFLKGFIEK